MYERTELLCHMLGWIECAKQPIKRNDALILLDQILFKMNQPRATDKEKELLKLTEDLAGIFLIQMGIGRERAKEITRDGHL